MLRKSYPYYLANRPVAANTDLEVLDIYSGKRATRVAFADAATAEERRRALDAIQERYLEVVPFVALGQILKPVAHRSNVSGFVASPLLAFWNVEKH